MEQNEVKWISQKIFTYQDPDTSVKLNICMDSGIIEDKQGRRTYCPPRILFQLTDSRTQANARIQIELQFSELSTLVDHIKRIVEADRKTVYLQQSNISPAIGISRYGFKGKKEMTLTLGVGGNKVPYVQIEIADPGATGGTRRAIFINDQIFMQIYNYCSQVRDNYAIIASSCLSSVIQERIYDEFKLFKGFQPVVQSVPRDVVDMPMDTPSVAIENEDNPMAYFNNLGDKLVDTILPSMPDTPWNANSVNIPKKTEQTFMPFIGTFLDYDPTKLTEWITAFLCADEKSQPIAFCPLNNIISQTMKVEPFKCDNPTFYKVQYFLDIMFRRNIAFYLKEGKFIAYPTFKLPSVKQFTPGSEAWAVSEEILFCFMIFTNLHTCYLRYLSENSKSALAVDSIVITQSFLKSYLSFFFMSMAIDGNQQKIKEELLVILDKCDKNGFLEKLNKFYADLTTGGSIDFSPRMMDSYFSSFLEDLPNLRTFEVGDIPQVFQENRIKDCGQINNIEEVRTLVAAFLGMEKQRVSDGRLEVFISCIKKTADPLIIKQIETKCKRYEDLIKLFREINVPEDIIRIKRVMDRDPSLKYKADIMSASKLLQEESSVSETRVLFDETIKNPENQNIHAESVLAELEGD